MRPILGRGRDRVLGVIETDHLSGSTETHHARRPLRFRERALLIDTLLHANEYSGRMPGEAWAEVAAAEGVVFTGLRRGAELVRGPARAPSDVVSGCEQRRDLVSGHHDGAPFGCQRAKEVGEVIVIRRRDPAIWFVRD